mmetsp:Transcript_12467/g.23008  ORF Transcript_12467/g.23008 Transcript_12467/m.23008 type:complete len:532 (+) Transcript_12467:52-1647(+)
MAPSTAFAPRNSIQTRLQTDIQARRRGVALAKVPRLQQARPVVRRRASHGSIQQAESVPEREGGEDVARETTVATSARLPSPCSKQLDSIGEGIRGSQGLSDFSSQMHANDARCGEGEELPSRREVIAFAAPGPDSLLESLCRPTSASYPAAGKTPARPLGKSQSASYLAAPASEAAGFGASSARFVDTAQWSARPVAWPDADDVHSPHTRKGFETRNTSTGVEAALVEDDVSDALPAGAPTVTTTRYDPLPYTAFDGATLRAREGQAFLDALDGDVRSFDVETKSGGDPVNFWPAGHTSEGLQALQVPSFCKTRDPPSSVKSDPDGLQNNNRRSTSILGSEEQPARRSRKGTGASHQADDGVRPAGLRPTQDAIVRAQRRSSGVQQTVKAGWLLQPDAYPDQLANSESFGSSSTGKKRQAQNVISHETEKACVYFNQEILRYSQPRKGSSKPTVDTFHRVCGDLGAEPSLTSHRSQGQLHKQRAASDSMAEILTMPRPLCQTPSSPGRRGVTRQRSYTSVGVASCFQWDG